MAPVDMVCLGLAELANGVVKGIVAGTLLQLDDVFSGDNMTGPGCDDRGTLAEGLGGGGCENSGKKGQEGGREVHGDELWLEEGDSDLMLV